MIRRPPRATQSRSSAASDVYKRQDLQPALHPGRPDLQVVLLRLYETHVAGRHEETAICEPEPAQEILRPADHPLQRSGGGPWRLEEHHLHLVELVDAQDPSGVPV